MPISEIELRKQEPKVPWYKSEAFITLLVVAGICFGLFMLFHQPETPEELREPYHFDSFETMDLTIGEIELFKKFPEEQTKWENTEISEHEYDIMTRVASYDPELRRIIDKAMADNVMTNREYVAVEVENREQWKRYEKRKLELTKERLVEVAKQ